MFGKTIELFYVDGSPDSLVTAELSNWNGKAIKIQRGKVQNCGREDIKGAGVYFLFCQDDDGSESVYIGEAENVLERLISHIRSGEEFYWNTAVVFVGRDLNKAHIRYLENQLVNITRECGRMKVLTKSTYSNTKLKESQIASMEEFIENIKVLINALGYRILVPVEKPDDSTILLYCKDAVGFVSAKGFVVNKGSKVSDSTVPSFETRAHSYFKLRERLFADGVIGEDKVFKVDYEFSSPSAAGSVVLGRNSKGLPDWKTKEGYVLKDV